jgi:hypothetical protein
MGWVIALLVLLIALYVGSYYAVVDRRPDEVVTEEEFPVPMSAPGGIPVMTTRTVTHRWLNSQNMIAVYPLEAMATIYIPVHTLDRRIRPDYWSPPPSTLPTMPLDPVP